MTKIESIPVCVMEDTIPSRSFVCEGSGKHVLPEVACPTQWCHVEEDSLNRPSRHICLILYVKTNMHKLRANFGLDATAHKRVSDISSLHDCLCLNKYC